MPASIVASPIGPRTITALRRVTVPARLRSRAGWVHGSTVVVDVPGEDAAVIRIRTVTEDSTGDPTATVRSNVRSSDASHAGDAGDRTRRRTVTEVGQVSIPVAVLARVGLDVQSRVYFVGVDGAPDTVWLLPESRVKMARRTRPRSLAGRVAASPGDKAGGGAR